MTQKKNISEAQRKAVSKYIRANYESFTIRSRMGLKEQVRQYAARKNESINQYVLDAIRKQLEADDQDLFPGQVP